jgi:hypothetical protein
LIVDQSTKEKNKHSIEGEKEKNHHINRLKQWCDKDFDLCEDIFVDTDAKEDGCVEVPIE